MASTRGLATCAAAVVILPGICASALAQSNGHRLHLTLQSASPQSFSGANQTITVKFSVTNHGTDKQRHRVEWLMLHPLRLFRSTTCSSRIVDVGSTVSCQTVYTTKTADVTRREISQDLWVAGNRKPQLGQILTNRVTLTVPFTGPQPQPPKAQQSNAGNQKPQNNQAGSNNPTAQSKQPTSAGTSTLTPAATITAAAARAAKMRKMRWAKRRALRTFMNRRASTILDMAPNSERMHGRLSGPRFDPALHAGPPRFADASAFPAAAGLGAIGAPGDDGIVNRRFAPGFSLSGHADSGMGRFAFATSLNKLRRAAQSFNAAKTASADRSSRGNHALKLGASEATGKTPPPPPQFDLWVQGVGTYYEDHRNGKREGHAGILYAGADYLLRPSILVGVLLQMDWTKDSVSGFDTLRKGRGWMAGPYLSARISRNVYFDLRVAGGQSTNRIQMSENDTDRFKTVRAVATARLTGNWSIGAFRFQPSVETMYFWERQEAYWSGQGIDIPQQTVAIGRASIGQEIGYRFLFRDKSLLEPFVGVTGIWDFSKTRETTAAGLAIDGGRFRGSIEAGATWRSASGISIRGSGTYDGLGDRDFRAIHGGVFLIVPLN